MTGKKNDCAKWINQGVVFANTPGCISLAGRQEKNVSENRIVLLDQMTPQEALLISKYLKKVK